MYILYILKEHEKAPLPLAFFFIIIIDIKRLVKDYNLYKGGKVNCTNNSS